MTSEEIQNPQIYTIGSFENDGWRDLMINRLNHFNFNDPRNHKQSSIARLDYEDMNAAMNSDIALVYLHSGRRAGTMSYSELGGARAKGRCIIAVDKNEEKDSLIKKIASHYYSTEDGVIDLIENKKYFSKSELDVLETVCMRFGTKNTKHIEDVSHEEAPWKMTSLLDNIPYTLAINDKDCVVSKEEIELFSKIYPN